MKVGIELMLTFILKLRLAFELLKCKIPLASSERRRDSDTIRSASLKLAMMKSRALAWEATDSASPVLVPAYVDGNIPPPLRYCFHRWHEYDHNHNVSEGFYCKVISDQTINHLVIRE
jgi:hypothetical protein